MSIAYEVTPAREEPGKANSAARAIFSTQDESLKFLGKHYG